ncbi:L-selectin-like isoform X1 [Carcharodon carcharias]|uniref:L-selectin-like isoform X1 n=1 Tax=Carcharodon carcharias TaxID=13397 RepID=UPI001B7DB043|nr:L-selectin-like isoform X1 [Carcharodon carcharias]
MHRSSSVLKICEKCKATACYRRGTCVELADGFRCICDQGFYGNNCENEKCKAGSCNKRGTCIELADGFRCICDHGFYGNKCENAITCTPLKKPEHSSVNCSGPYGEKHYNASCYFSCDDGYTLEGDPKTICRESGNWNTHDIQCTVNHRKLILIIVPVGAVAAVLSALAVIYRCLKRNHQEQSTGDDLSMQQKTLAYENQGIYALPTLCLNNETPRDEMYVNNLSVDQDMYKNLE